MASPPSSSANQPLFVVCDFDGTITMRDTLDLLVSHYAPEMWDEVEPRLQRGEISLLEAMEEEFAQVRVTEEQAIEFVVRETEIRPGFEELLQWLEQGGHRLIIVSAGFRVLIDAVLSEAGLGGLHIHSGDAVFTSGGTYLSFPRSDAPCFDQCGFCKTEMINAHGPFDGPVVHIGDGFSDRCAAEEADIVFARRGLAAYLDREGVPYHPFEDFHDVLAVLHEVTADPSAGPGT